MTLFLLFLLVGAVVRLTRFVNDDVLAEPLRAAVADRYGEHSKAAYLTTCAWCASIWLAAAVFGLAFIATGQQFTGVNVTMFIAGALTASYAAGLAGPHTGD